MADAGAASTKNKPVEESKQKMMIHLQTLFSSYDQRNVGMIDDKALALLLREVPMDTEEVQKTLKQFNGQKNITFTDFLTIAQRGKVVSKIMIKNYFEKYDVDNDGYLNPKELKRFLVDVKQQPSDTDVRNMIEVADTDKDGKLSYQEFENVILIGPKCSP